MRLIATQRPGELSNRYRPIDFASKSTLGVIRGALRDLDDLTAPTHFVPRPGTVPKMFW